MTTYKDVGTLQEIGARVGDVVVWNEGGPHFTVDQHRLDNWGENYRIVSRAMTDHTNAPAIPPVVGKRYVMRNGKVTGIMRDTDDDSGYPFEDEYAECWTRNGKYYRGFPSHQRDLVAEYPAEAVEGTVEAQVGSDAPTMRQKTLEAASDAVLKDRNNTYGGPEDSFGLIAAYWSAHLDVDIKPHDVAIMMTLLKLARLNKNPTHFDSWVDVAGFAACGAEVAK